MKNFIAQQPIRRVTSDGTDQGRAGTAPNVEDKCGLAEYFTNTDNPDLYLTPSRESAFVPCGVTPGAITLLPMDGQPVRMKIPMYNEETHGVYEKKGKLHYRYQKNDRTSDLALINANLYLEMVYRPDEYSCNIMQIGVTTKEGTFHFLLRQNCSEKELVEVLQKEYFISKGSKIGWKEVEDILRNYLNTGMNKEKFESTSLFPGWKQSLNGKDYYYEFAPLQNKGTWYAKDLLVHPCKFNIPEVTATESIEVARRIIGEEGFKSSAGILVSIAVMSVLQRLFAEQGLYNQMVFLFDSTVATQRTVCNLLQFANRDRQDIFPLENKISTNQLLHEVKDRVCIMSCGGMNKAVEKMFDWVANTAVTEEKEALTTGCQLKTVVVLFSSELIRKGIPNADNYVLMESPDSINTPEDIFPFYYHFIRHVEDNEGSIKRLMLKCCNIIEDYDMGQKLSTDVMEVTATMLVVSSMVTQWYINTCAGDEDWVPDAECIQEMYDYVISIVEHDAAATITFDFLNLLHEMVNSNKICLCSGRYEENANSGTLAVFYDDKYAYMGHEAVKNLLLPKLEKVKSLRSLENILKASNVLVPNERGNTVQIAGRDGKRHRVLRFVRNELFDEAEYMFNGGR